MVEELARWKAALCQRTTDLQESIKRLLEERKSIRDASLKTYRYLFKYVQYPLSNAIRVLILTLPYFTLELLVFS